MDREDVKFLAQGFVFAGMIIFFSYAFVILGSIGGMQ
jgi:hypothetical protein